jgi:Zn-dependent alcohol dehydrogenase
LARGTTSSSAIRLAANAAPACRAATPIANAPSRPTSAARLDGSNGLSHNGAGLDVHGHFFGQSSFATHSLATERNVVKVPRDVPLELLGPLGCGLQTGAGAVLN